MTDDDHAMALSVQSVLVALIRTLRNIGAISETDVAEIFDASLTSLERAPQGVTVQLARQHVELLHRLVSR